MNLKTDMKYLLMQEYKGYFFDVTTELINAATDSLNIGNAIGLLGISEHTSNMITGIMMNTENKTFFNALLKKSQ